MNPLVKLSEFGQSPWLDFIQRSYTRDGSLARLISDDGIKGVTSNPAIFEAAIAGSSDYDSDIVSLTGEGLSAAETYDVLSVTDVQEAADLFRGVYDATSGRDGYVSLEVSPLLAHDTDGTIVDARRLWGLVDRPNVMIKVPATQAGVPAIRQLISEGININVTLLFSVQRYKEVAHATIAGLRQRHEAGLPVQVASVASFFVSRVDTLVDPMLEALGDGSAKDLVGEVAVANCRMAYGAYEEIFSGSQFADLRASGAWTQRVLWASTSSKNPAYGPVKYVEALVARDTVNTLPLATIDAYRETGDPADSMAGMAYQGEIVIDQLRLLGIEIDDMADRLEREAIDKFVQPFEKLLAAIETKRESIIV